MSNDDVLTGKVGGIIFGILSPEEIERLSVMEIVTEDIFDEEENKKFIPVKGGLCDPRLGITKVGECCPTCGGKYQDCPGHFGHINLAQPVYHYGFIQYVLNVLRCVCPKCSNLLLPRNSPMFKTIMKTKRNDLSIEAILKSAPNSKTRVTNLSKASLKVNFCGAIVRGTKCNTPIPSYKYEDIVRIYADYSNMTKNDLSQSLPFLAIKKGYLHPQQCMDIFSKINNEDGLILGFDGVNSKPEWMIMNKLLVSPNQLRIITKTVAGKQQEEDRTRKLSEILSTNNKIKADLLTGCSHEKIDEFHQFLQSCISGYFDVKSQGSQQKNLAKGKKPTEGIANSLSRKEGLIRKHMVGKRIESSSRTVIGPDPDIDIDQVVVPETIAKILTYPERVTSFNKDKLTKLLLPDKEGNIKANFLVLDDGTKDEKRIDLSIADPQSLLPLKEGSIVERHMMNDDLVVFNRQPSLHRSSIMSFRAKVLPHDTFRFQLTVTTPFNADFDGDEMNLHLLQTPEDRAELQELLYVDHNFSSPQTGGPTMGLIQDYLVSLRMLTRKNTFLDFRQVTDLLIFLPSFKGKFPHPAIVKNIYCVEFQHTNEREKNLRRLLESSPLQYDKYEDHETEDDMMRIYLKCKPTTDQEVEIAKVLRCSFSVRFSKTPIRLWTGKQIFGFILPETVNYKRDTKSVLGSRNMKYTLWNGEKGEYPKHFNDDDATCIIRGGYFCSGHLCQKSLGNSHGGLVHHLIQDFGNTFARKKMQEMLSISSVYISERGLTFGGSDLPFDIDVQKKTIKGILDKVNEHIKKWKSLKISEWELEIRTQKILDEARSEASSGLIQRLDEDNQIKEILSAGSKGKWINPAQMLCCIGQCSVEGKRIPNSFRNRVSPHYTQFDDSPKVKGFIENSLLQGLHPTAQFNYAMSGREGLLDLAIKTTKTGYLQRRLSKSVEDVAVQYDGTVRNTKGHLFQFRFGEDGFDTCAIEFGFCDYMDCISSDKKLQKNYIWSILRDQLSEDEEWDWIEKEEVRIRNDLYIIEKDPSHYQKWNTPIHFQRLLESAQQYQRLHKTNSDVTLKACDVIKETIKLHEELFKCHVYHDDLWDAKVFILMRSNYASKKILSHYKLNRVGWDWAKNETVKKFKRALSQAGDMVGVNAAHSVGEPAMQMTLNVFHNIAVAGKNIPLGVPRLCEIVDNTKSKTKQTSLMSIFLKKEWSKSREKVQDLSEKLPQLFLHDVFLIEEIWYDPILEDNSTNLSSHTCIEEDKAFVKIFSEIGPDKMWQNTDTQWSDYIVRITIDGVLLCHRGIRLDDIIQHIRDLFDGFMMEWNNVYSNPCIVRIRPPVDDSVESGEDYFLLRELLNKLKEDILIGGVIGITKTFVKEDRSLSEFQTNGEKEFMIDTEGSNIEEILALPQVDSTRTISNDIDKISKILGIEAAQQSIVNEINAVLQQYDIHVDHRNQMLLASTMCFREKVSGMTRNGILKHDSPLMRATFEQTSDIFQEAARYGQKDFVKGVSDAIILGSRPPIGTGMMDIFVDWKGLLKMQTGKTYKDSTRYNGEFIYDPTPAQNIWEPPSPLPTTFVYQ